MSFSLTAPAPAVLKMCTHQNARVLIAEEEGLTILPNTLLDGKKAASLAWELQGGCCLPCLPEERANGMEADGARV